jgi:hypothetical protein
MIEMPTFCFLFGAGLTPDFPTVFNYGRLVSPSTFRFAEPV